MLWLELAPLLVYASLITAAHELGHALAAWPAGYRLTSLGLGRGPRLLRLPLPNGVIVVLHAIPFAGGSVVAIPARGEIGRRGAWFHAGGVLAQAALGAGVALAPEQWWSRDFADFNLVVLIWNLIPWQIQGQTSDGWWLLSRLWPALIERLWPGQGASGALALKGPAFARLAEVERGRGSPLGLRYALVMQAWTALQRRSLDEAARLMGALPEVRRAAPPALRALEAHVGLELARLGGPAPSAPPDPEEPLVVVSLARAAVGEGRFADAAAFLGAAPGAEPAQGLAALARLELLLENGAPDDQVEGALLGLLDRLGPNHGDPIAAREAASRAVARLEAAAGPAVARATAALRQPWLRAVVAAGSG